MATFRLFIDTDNDAFNPDPGPELARLLRKIADRIEDDVPDHYRTILDINGNDVGRYAVKEAGQ